MQEATNSITCIEMMTIGMRIKVSCNENNIRLLNAFKKGNHPFFLK
jgi:hypothetical protein